MTSIATPRPSEGGHWYNRNAESVYQVPDSTGKRMIEPDIRHARKLNLMPGQSSISGCAHKQKLVDWMVEQGVMAALTLPRQKDETDAQFIKRCIEDSKESARKAREKGTEIHAAIEDYFGAVASVKEPLNFIDQALRPYAEGVANRLLQATGERDWIPEKCVVHRRGYGTKIDLIAPGWLVDIKTKDGDENKLFAEELYDEHYMQLACSRRANQEIAAHPCGILFVSRTHPGVAVLKIAEEEKLQRGLRMFDALLEFWKQKNKHDPSW